MDSKMKAWVECNVVEIYYENKEKNILGTGFFIDKDVLITAYHVVANHMDDKDFCRLHCGDGLSFEEVIVSDNKTFCILKVKFYNDELEPLRFMLGFPVKHGQICNFFGYSAFSCGNGCWVSGNINTSSKMEYQAFNWTMSVNEKSSTYHGCSGSPVFIDDYLIGIIQEETASPSIGVINISFSCMEAFKEKLNSNWYKAYSLQEQILRWKKEGYKVSSLKDKEKYLEKATKKDYKKISLDFFEIDDEIFREKFHRRLSEHCNVYISGLCEEEILYCILNELKKFQEDVIIVEDENSWNHIGETYDNWFIGIANFHSNDVILPIERKSNIFFYGEDDFNRHNETLFLRRRTRNLIEEKLWDLGIENPSDFFERTHGFFLGIKRELFDGKYISKPLWKNENRIHFWVALLCGKWTDCDNDKRILEDLSGHTYEDFLICIEQFSTGEEPFYLKFHGLNGQVNYRIVNFELSWHYLASKIAPSLWLKFYKSFLKVMQNEGYSSSIKFGMIRTLVFRAISNKSCQLEIDQTINQLLDNISSKEDWYNIATFLPSLCEASPNSISERFKKEIFDVSSPVKELFKEGTAASIYAPQSIAYTHVLWTLEQLLYYQEHAGYSINMLFELDCMKVDYKIGNTPQNLLIKIFCNWKNFYPISVNRKISLLKKYLSNDKYQQVWDIVFQNIPSGLNQSFIQDNYPPSYRIPDNIYELNSDDSAFLRKKYGELCIEHIDGIVERFNKIIQKLDMILSSGISFPMEYYNKLCISSDDAGKFSIMWALRHEIYKNNYFKDSNWVLSESGLNLLETMYKKITKEVFDDQYLYYIYWFQASPNYDILNPAPFDKKEHSDIQINNKLRDDELRTVMGHFCNEGMSPVKLVEIASSNNTIFEQYNSGYMGNIGRNLALFYPEYSDGFNTGFYNELMAIYKYNPNLKSVLLNYFLYSVKYVDFPVVIKNVGESLERNDLDLYVDILAAYGIEKDSLIFSCREETKNRFWQRWNPYLFDSDDKEVVLKVLSALFSLNRVDAYVYILYFSMKQMSSHELLEYMINIDSMKSMTSCTSETNYHLTEIIKHLEQQDLSPQDKSRLIQIEYNLILVLDWNNLISLQEIISENAQIYGQIIKNQHEYSNVIWWKIYQQCRFCPGVIQGHMIEEKFDTWITNFKSFLDKENLSEYYYSYLGKLFAYSPMGTSSAYPHDLVRNFIEGINNEEDFENLRKSYVTEVYNKRGIFLSDAGKSELQLAHSFQDNMERLLECDCSRTANIYRTLVDIYTQMSKEERERAENEP